MLVRQSRGISEENAEYSRGSYALHKGHIIIVKIVALAMAFRGLHVRPECWIEPDPVIVLYS